MWSRIRPRCATLLGKSIAVAFSNSRSPHEYEFATDRLDGLAMLVQEVLEQDPFSGHLFAFRGRFLFHPPHKFRRLDDIAKHRNGLIQA